MLDAVKNIFFLVILNLCLNCCLAQKPLIMSGYVGGKYTELIVGLNNTNNFSATLVNHFDYLKTEFSADEEYSIFLNLKTCNFQSYIQTIRLIKNNQQSAYKGFYYASDGHIGHVEFKIKEALNSREDNQSFISFNELYRKFIRDIYLSFPENSNLFELEPQTTSFHLNENIFIEQQFLPQLLSVENNFLSVLLKSFGDSTQNIEYKISFIKILQSKGENYLALFERKKKPVNSVANEYCHEIYFGIFETENPKKSLEWNNSSEKKICMDEGLLVNQNNPYKFEKNKNFTLLKLREDYQIQFKPDLLSINLNTNKGKDLKKTIDILIENDGNIRIKTH